MDILVIDDEPTIREMLLAFLAEEQHRVRTASSGESGLWALEERPADLVLTDIKMPGMSGIDVLRRVRETWPATEVVVITGYATVEDAVAALRQGAYDFLLKPVRLAHLEAVVRRCEERILAARDNRELREVVEKLRELNERKEKFIALANHELRTPTTVAAGLVSLLTAKAGAMAEDARELVLRADAALRRLREVVEDLGDLALRQSGGLRVKPAAEPVGRLLGDLRDVCETYRALRKLKIEVRSEVSEELELNADRRKLGRALGALLQNAVKFTPDDGEVLMYVRQEGESLLFEVQDTGVGVAEGEASRIFDLFYEAGDTRHHRSSGHEFRGGGLGIGLPLALAIAKTHGGELSYTPRPGGGSVFCLKIPIDRREAIATSLSATG